MIIDSTLFKTAQDQAAANGRKWNISWHFVKTSNLAYKGARGSNILN